MLIDFHTHAFPEHLAEKTMTKLAAIAQMTPETDGTVSGLQSAMRGWGVDRFVLLHIATRPAQQRTINNWAASVQCARIDCFGTIHPDAPDAVEELSRIRQLGLRGVKLHPDYQGFFVDEARMDPIYAALCDLDLPVMIHAGFDPLSPGLIHAPADAVRRAHRRFPKMILIAAHVGGFKGYDDTEKYLVGEDIYLDVSMAAEADCDPAQLGRIIRDHGAERVLFASDCPWGSAKRAKALLDEIPLSEKERALIFYQNALRILDC